MRSERPSTYLEMIYVDPCDLFKELIRTGRKGCVCSETDFSLLVSECKNYWRFGDMLLLSVLTPYLSPDLCVIFACPFP